jgi:hypothetical protein
MALGKKTGGRVAGTPNKFTASVRDAVQEAFHRAGGVEYLLKVAQEDPRTFVGIVQKLIPQEIKAEHSLSQEWLDALSQAAGRIRTELIAPSDS